METETDLPYVIIRTYSAGVWYAQVAHRQDREAALTNARRLWYWDGAATLSELAVHGTSKPRTCKFPVAVPKVTVTEVIEVLSTTAEARASIDAVPVWSAR